MQYENSMSSCKRKNVLSLKKQCIILSVLFISSLLVSRVVIYVSANNVIGIAPFGVCFLIAIIMKKQIKNIFITFLGTSIGYLSVINSIGEKYAMFLSIVLVFLYAITFIKINIKISDKVIFLIIILSYITYGFVINKYDAGLNITLSLVNAVVIIPIYYIVKYGVKCISEFNSNYFMTSEDFLSVAVITSLVVAGIGDFSVFGVSFRNIFAYLVVVVIASIGGTTYGASIGLCMGIIVGVSSGDLMVSIIFYGVSGLVSGIFKETGRIYVVLSYIITFIIISVYFENLNIYSLIEAIVSASLVFALPKKFYKLLECELDVYNKRDKLNNIELQEIKLQFAEKVKDLGSALNTVANSLEGIGENDRLSYRSKSAALIENLTDRVCSKCTRSKTCWERDFNATYNAFEKLIKGCEDNKIIFPHQLDKVCFEKFQLIKGADSLVSNLKSNEIYKNRLQEGRIIASKHLSEVSLSIDEMLQNFKRDISVDGEAERILKKALNKNMIYPKKIFCYVDEAGRTKVKLSFTNCEGSNYCIRNVVPLISKILNTNMDICSDGCKIKYDTNDCFIVLAEAPKFKAISYAAVCTKSNEKLSGDSYCFEKCKNGKYINVISDGMGFGPRASKDSMTTIKIIEKYMETGFDPKIAIDMTNDVMSMKFDENESFSTLDFNIIDLYSGKAEFIKMGAVSSFIKRGSKIREISSCMPPFGTVDKIEIDSVKVDLKNGDLIVMVSDGIMDINKNKSLDSVWLQNFLTDCSKEPKKLALDILVKAKDLSGDKISDDMTVIVCKVQSEILSSHNVYCFN